MKISKLNRIIAFGIIIALAGTSAAYADLENIQTGEEDFFQANVTAGYRGVSKNENTGRALEYDSQESSPVFDVDLSADQGSYLLSFDLNYLNEKDYSAEAQLNSKGITQFSLRSDRFYHNLDHIPYDNGYTGSEDYPMPPGATPRTLTGTPAEGSRNDGTFPNSTGETTIRTYYTDHDRNDTYGLQLDINEAKFKIKHPTYPAHLNLSYWRFEKKGDKQMRFVGENCATVCHMQSKTRDMDRVTEEVKIGADAHAGVIDLVFEALFRTFRDREEIPRDTFALHFRNRDLSENPMEHSEDPDSKLTEFTIKANMAPSGGLVGSTSFTIGERENQSDLASVSPTKATTDYYKTAADITYTPSQHWTFNLRHRLLDMDSDNPNYIDNYGSTNLTRLEVRDAIDITRAWYEVSANYRPSQKLTLRGELRREDIDRGNTGPGHEHHSPGDVTDPVEINDEWQLPEEETIITAKVGFHSRMLEKSALKLSGWASHQESDDPAYGQSFSKRKQLFLSGSYNPIPTWGLLANANILKEENNEHELHGFSFDREKQQQSYNLNTYIVPLDGLSFDLNYGYLHTDIDQGVLFGTGSRFVPLLGFPVDYAIPDETAGFDQKVHTISLGMTWQALENLSCRLEGQHAFSRSSFTTNFSDGGPYPFNVFAPPAAQYSGTTSNSGLEGISELDIRQTSLRGRVNWKIDKNWSCSVEATHDDYDDKNSEHYDGTVETAMISFSRTW